MIPIAVLTGFLGSGKTTLLRRWRHHSECAAAAVIVHDLSEFGLDAELLADEGISPKAGMLTGRVAALHGVHARERLHLSLGSTLEDIAELVPAPPLVLVESTGAAHPWPLIAALTQNQNFALRHFIVAVDALSLHRDFADGLALTGKPAHPADSALLHAAAILTEQIAFASIIILTKTDTIPESTVQAQVKNLQRLHPRAAIGLSAHAGLLLPQLDGVPAPNLETLHHRAQTMGLLDSENNNTTAAGVDCLVLGDKRPFHPQRLFDACQSHLGTGLYRTKGYLWLASRPGHVLLWQQAGSQISLELTGFWRAEVSNNADGRLLPEEISLLKDQMRQLDPVFGDRHVELTLIGLPAAREAFASALREAFCTPAEIAAWQRGELFPDPWPQSLKRF
jgi:G3E family GTPase